MPRGAITLLVGIDGTGKSTLITGLTAGWTQGDLTGSQEQVHLSLVEDDAAAVTIPRLRAAGADLDRTRLPGRPWSFPRDLADFERYVTEEEITVAVLDPLDHHVDGLAAQKGRQALGELAQIAGRHRLAIVAVHHFNKNGASLDTAIGGGRGVKGVARSILVWGPEPVGPTGIDADSEGDGAPGSVLAHHKSSYGPRMPSLLYERVEARIDDGRRAVSMFELVGDCGHAPEAVYAGNGVGLGSERGKKRNMARELILRFLAGAARTAADLRSDVMSAGISERTFNRARAELADDGMIEQYQAGGQHWWRLAVPAVPPLG